jgi:hypothetical protein
VKKYQVSTTESPIQVPTGIKDANPLVDQHVLGTINANTFKIDVLDGENPAFYDFRIKVETSASFQWFPPFDVTTQYRLALKCPDKVEVFPS